MTEFDFKKYFWVVTAATVVICTVFAAKGVNHYLEAKYLGEENRAAISYVKPRPKRRSISTSAKSGALLVSRNMFCSDCEPEVAELPPTVQDTNNDGTVPVTSLPIQLVATNIVLPPAGSFATIRSTSSAHQGAYLAGDVIPNAGEVKEIHGKYVYFQNSRTRRLEQISLLGKDGAPRPTPKPKPKSNNRSTAKSELAKAINDGIRKISDTEYEVDRALVDRLTQDPLAIKGARIVPSIKDGKSRGFRLYAIRPSSVFAKLGIRNGDTVHAINGFELKSMSDGLEVYGKLQSATNLSVSMTRRGKPVSLNYTIR